MQSFLRASRRMRDGIIDAHGRITNEITRNSPQHPAGLDGILIRVTG